MMKNEWNKTPFLNKNNNRPLTAKTKTKDSDINIDVKYYLILNYLFLGK
jgi:hypothetical protein